MFERFYPDEIQDSAYEIEYEALYDEGYRGLLFDIDNTLVEHGREATARAIALFERLGKIGFSYCLISNNNQERVDCFNRDIGAYTVVRAKKPSKKGYERGMKQMGTGRADTIFVGDQLFTDIWGAKRSGIRNILVKPIDKREEIQIVLKRRLEWVVLWEYGRRKKNGRKDAK